MNEMGFAGTALGYAGQQSASLNQIQKVETLPSLLQEISKYGYQLRDMTRQASDNLSGSVPAPGNPDCERAGTIIASAREIRDVLCEAVNNQQRVLNTLAL